jgi:hypothetical protein
MPIFNASGVEVILEKLQESRQTRIEAIGVNKHLERCRASELPAKATSIAIRKMPRLSTVCSRPSFLPPGRGSVEIPHIKLESRSAINSVRRPDKKCAYEVGANRSKRVSGYLFIKVPCWVLAPRNRLVFGTRKRLFMPARPALDAFTLPTMP